MKKLQSFISNSKVFNFETYADDEAKSIKRSNQSVMVKYMLKVIKGGKFDLEKLLVKALFGDSSQEIERISNLLKSTQPADSTHLNLVKSDQSKPTK